MIYLDAGQFDWMHALEVFFGGIMAFVTAFGTVFAVWWKFKNKNEEQAESERQALLAAATLNEENTETRHQANLKVQKEISQNVEDLTTALELNPPHEHDESNIAGLPADTPLRVGNIRYKKLKRIRHSDE
jgi:flagellar biosynthesis/type III secretory pathway M-ring protein FliF/YscJ